MNINKKLIKRFAVWLMVEGRDPNSATQLIAAVENNSPMVGKRIPLCWDNSGLKKSDLDAEFNEDEIAEIFSIPDRFDPNYDYTRVNRSSRRQKILNEKAISLGFEGLSDMQTRWKNGDFEIAIKWVNR